MITLYKFMITSPDGMLHPRCNENIWGAVWFSTPEEAIQGFQNLVEECLAERDSIVKVVPREFVVSEHAARGTTVILDEEHGLATWIWDSGLSHGELVKYWSDLLSVDHLYLRLKLLPGMITCVLPTGSHGLVLSKDGNSVIRCGGGVWTSHLWKDNDSWLQDDKGTRIHHRGFQENGHLYKRM
jgi:hypothetical protein